MPDLCDVGRPRWPGDRKRGPVCERLAVWHIDTGLTHQWLCQEHTDALVARLAAAGRKVPVLRRVGEETASHG